MAKLHYDVEKKLYYDLKDRIVAPKFQRNFVWKKKARKQLIESIKAGLPIGCFLLQKLNNGKYNVIDGRQRFSTLLDYEEHRYDYIEDVDVNTEDIEELLRRIPTVNKIWLDYAADPKKKILNSLKNNVVKQLKNKNSTDDDIKFELRNAITDLFPNLKKEDLKIMNNEVSSYYVRVRQLLDMSNIYLPCIIFNEDVSDDLIVDTFINLNTKGTKLSKYDLYSASWQNDLVIVDDNEIIEKVISKYKDSLENNQNIETEDFNEELIRTTKEINVFEYAYALSKIIGEKCNNEIYQIKEASEVDSLGFSILSGILNVSSKKMVDLSDKLLKSKLDYVDLKNKVVACTLDIQKNLEWFCKTPDGRPIYYHSLNQLVSYIVTLFKAKYTINSSGKIIDNNYKTKVKDFLYYLPKWYLYDNIRGYWAGSGDTKLDNLTLIDNIFESRYFNNVAEESFRTAIYEWMQECNQEKNSNLGPIPKLFINYIIKKQCSEPHASMDYEHIIPQARLEMLSTREKGVVGISSPSNITLIPSFDNRSKREKTYYELIDCKDETALTYSSELLEKYVYPTHSEIKFIEAKETFNVQNFNQFKKDRTNTITNLFFSLYYSK